MYRYNLSWLTVVELSIWQRILCILLCFVVVVATFLSKTHYLSRYFEIPCEVSNNLIYLTHCKICYRLRGYQDTDLAPLHSSVVHHPSFATVIRKVSLNKEHVSVSATFCSLSKFLYRKPRFWIWKICFIWSRTSLKIRKDSNYNCIITRKWKVWSNLEVNGQN